MRIIITLLSLTFSFLSHAEMAKNPFAYDPEINGPVYEVVERRCLEGTLKENASPIRVGSLLAYDIFYRDGEEINNLLNNGGWDLIHLPYPIKGNPGTVCDNAGKPTTYILTIRRIEWPRESN